MKKVFFFLASVALLVCLFPTTILALGVAIGPATFEITNALRGTEYQSTITVFNPSTADTHYNLRADGQAASWLSFYRLDDQQQPIKDLTIVGQNSTNVLLKVNVPSDTPNGQYTATIYAETDAVGAGGNGITAVMQAKSELTIGVTGDQIIDGTVNSINVNNPEAGMPMRLVVSFRNTGNVVVQPTIYCLINKGNEKVAEFTNDTTSVEPQSQQDIQTEWATTADQAGDYTGKATVSLGDKVLATQDLTFTILPAGTFTKQGALTSLNYVGQPLLDTTLKIQAGFQNTGEGDALVKFIGEVYFGGDLIDTVNSEDTLVPAGQTGIITSYLKLSQTGNYTINGYISYYGKQTETKELDINVTTNNATTNVTTVTAANGSQVPVSTTEKPSGTGKVLVYFIVGGAVVIGILAGVLIILRNSRKHAHEKHQ